MISAAVRTQVSSPANVSAWRVEMADITSGMFRSGRRPPVIKFKP